MERTITVHLPDGMPGMQANADTQVALHPDDWVAFREGLGWLGSTLGAENLSIDEGSGNIWVHGERAEARYVLFAPSQMPSLHISRLEYVRLLLGTALLRP